jgi:predicted transcriptional regulator
VSAPEEKAWSGRKCRTAAEGLGLTQMELGRLAGVAQAVVSRVFNGEYKNRLKITRALKKERGRRRRSDARRKKGR